MPRQPRLCTPCGQMTTDTTIRYDQTDTSPDARRFCNLHPDCRRQAMDELGRLEAAAQQRAADQGYLPLVAPRPVEGCGECDRFRRLRQAVPWSDGAARTDINVLLGRHLAEGHPVRVGEAVASLG